MVDRYDEAAEWEDRARGFSRSTSRRSGRSFDVDSDDELDIDVMDYLSLES